MTRTTRQSPRAWGRTDLVYGTKASYRSCFQKRKQLARLNQTTEQLKESCWALGEASARGGPGKNSNWCHERESVYDFYLELQVFLEEAIQGQVKQQQALIRMGEKLVGRLQSGGRADFELPANWEDLLKQSQEMVASSACSSAHESVANKEEDLDTVRPNPTTTSPTLRTSAAVEHLPAPSTPKADPTTPEVLSRNTSFSSQCSFQSATSTAEATAATAAHVPPTTLPTSTSLPAADTPSPVRPHPLAHMIGNRCGLNPQPYSILPDPATRSFPPPAASTLDHVNLVGHNAKGMVTEAWQAGADTIVGWFSSSSSSAAAAKGSQADHGVVGWSGGESQAAGEGGGSMSLQAMASGWSASVWSAWGSVMSCKSAVWEFVPKAAAWE